MTIFISRADADAAFAGAIGQILEGAGYEVVLQQWDFANRNFMERMDSALSSDGRVVALLSPEYLNSEYCQAEWQSALAGDPLNTKSRLILLRVAECEPRGLLACMAYWDLVPIREDRQAVARVVLDALREDRARVGPAGIFWRQPRTICDAEAVRSVAGFTGRSKELAALSAALARDGALAAVHGMGGVGKSSLAREYAARYRDGYSVIWWLPAQNEDNIIDALLRFGALLMPSIAERKDRRAAAELVTTTLLHGFAKPVLLIFDNLEDERLARRWLPADGARALITSRDAAWSSEIAAIAVPAWDLDTASDYVRRESGRNDVVDREARAIAEKLGGLPLALSQAVALLRATRTLTPGRYLKNIEEFLDRAPGNVEYPHSVFATFSAATGHAEAEAPGAAALLCFAASFAPNAIPDELFRQQPSLYGTGLRPILPGGAQGLDLRSARDRELGLDEALGALDRLSLLTFTEETRTYATHRLVQLAARHLAGEAGSAWEECAVAVADAAFPVVDFTSWPQCERLLSHARAALDCLPESATFLPAAHLANACGTYLQERGEYAAAEPLEARALRIREEVLGPDHSDVGQSLHKLAAARYYLGRFVEAESLFLRAVRTREKALGAEHADVAASLNGLAGVYDEQGRYHERDALYARALAIWEKALGPDHTNVAHALNNVAMKPLQERRYDEAIPLITRAMGIWRKRFGPEHPLVGTSLHNLAFVHKERQNFEEAARLFEQSLALLEKSVGVGHPRTAGSLNNLAHTYGKLGRIAEAEALYARALAVREKALGSDHPLVARILDNIAELHADQQRNEEAERAYRRALEIRESKLVLDHPEVADTLLGLAKLYASTGRRSEAQALCERALWIREKSFGADDESTTAAREQLKALQVQDVE